MLSDLIRIVERPSAAGASGPPTVKPRATGIAVRSISDGIACGDLLGMVTLPDTQTGAHSGL